MARSVIDAIMVPDSGELAERVEAVKRGIEAKRVVQVADRLGWPRQRLLDPLGLQRAKVERMSRTGAALSPSEGSRVIGVERLIWSVHRMVEESGDLEGFDAALWLGQWLNSAVPALGGRRPAEYLDTADGQQLVAMTIAQIQSGAYSKLRPPETTDLTTCGRPRVRLNLYARRVHSLDAPSFPTAVLGASLVCTLTTRKVSSLVGLRKTQSGHEWPVISRSKVPAAACH